MSAVVYEEQHGYFARKNMVTLRLLAAIKEKQIGKTLIIQKISRFRRTMP